MTATTRQAIRLAVDSAQRAKLQTRTGNPHRRPEEQHDHVRPGDWIPVAARRAPRSPFFCLSVYEGEEC